MANAYPKFLSFRRDTRGATAVMFAMVLALLIGAAGLAADAYRMYRARSEVQSAMDGALLAAGAGDATDGKAIGALIQKYLAANLAASDEIEAGTVTASYDASSRKLTTSVDASMPTMMLGLAGLSEVSFTVRSEAVRAAPGPLELVLALDTTASMTEMVGGVKKIDTLKSAAANLVNTVMDSPYASVGVVPFSAPVNVGTEYKDAAWLTPMPDQTFDYCVTSGGSGLHCEEEKYIPCVKDGVASTCWQQPSCTWEVPPGTPVCTKKTISWNGCIATRKGYETSIANPGNPKYPYSGNSCPSKMLNLASDKSAVTDKINALTTGGDTYIPNGLLWAWNLLSSEGPLKTAMTKAESEAKGGKKVAVLMTDGVNTLQPVDNGYYNMLDQQQNVDDTLRTLCANVKKDGIILYTVAFAVADSNVKSILKGCASDSAKYFDASDSAGLSEAFRKIGASLQPLRLSK